MNYSLEKVGTVAGCDTLLASAEKKKQVLERKRRNLGESIGEFAARTDHISNELASVQSLLESFTVTYHALPKGSMDKLSLNVDIKRLEVREAQLYKIILTYNLRSLLAKQVDHNRLDSQVLAIDSYAAALQDKRTVLSNATLPISNAEQALPKAGQTTQNPGLKRQECLSLAAFRASRLYTKNNELKKGGTTPKLHLPVLLAVRQKQQAGKRSYNAQMRLTAFHSYLVVMHNHTIKNFRARAHGP